MTRYTPDRAFYIPNESRTGGQPVTEQRDTESTAVAYLYTGMHGQPVAKMFGGKRAKPDEFVRYSSEASRDAAVQRYFESVRARERYAIEQREQRKAIAKKANALDFTGETYLSAASVAALVRATLKESFPSVKFSVRSDGCVRISWTDGPSRAAVERIAKQFEGSYFDGMIDYKGNIYHSLDGRRVSFGADFVFCSRELSRASLESAALMLAAKYAPTNQPAALFEPSQWSPGYTVKANPEFPGACESSRMHGEVDLMGPESDDWQTGRFHSAAVALEYWFDSAMQMTAKPSPTLARIAVLGSDGYGNTIDTPEGKPAGAGYAQFERDDMAKARAEAEAAPVQPINAEAAAIQAPHPADLLPDASTADLFAALVERVAAAMPPPPEPVHRAPCEVIDFAPHLAAHIERAANARRVN